MLKATLPFILIAALSLANPLGAAMQQSASDSLLRTNTKPKAIDRETLRRNISETMESIEFLAIQIKNASSAEKKEILTSGKRDFNIPKGYINNVMDSVDSLIKAFAKEEAVRADNAALKGLAPETPKEKALLKKLATDEASVKDLREDARDAIRSLHKSESEDYIRNVRNWIMVSEGSLRHDHPATSSLVPATATAVTKP